MRFLLETVYRNQGHVRTELKTVEADCPELEKALDNRGKGYGVDGDDFHYTKLIGVEAK